MLHFSQVSIVWLSAFHDYFLFPEDFEAWVHGPVIPALYFEYKQYGYSPIPKAEYMNQDSLSPEIRAVLNMVHNIYGRYDGKYLEELTHQELPWIKARGNCKCQGRFKIEPLSPV